MSENDNQQQENPLQDLEEETPPTRENQPAAFDPADNLADMSHQDQLAALEGVSIQLQAVLNRASAVGDNPGLAAEVEGDPCTSSSSVEEDRDDVLATMWDAALGIGGEDFFSDAYDEDVVMARYRIGNAAAARETGSEAASAGVDCDGQPLPGDWNPEAVLRAQLARLRLPQDDIDRIVAESLPS